MKPFRLLVLMFTLSSFTSILCAQDPIFSQFYAAPLQLNPAFAGTTLAPRISLNYRNQWPAFGNAYTTTAASYEQLFEPLNSSVGLMLQSDNAGDGIYKSTNVLAAFGYRLKMNDNFLSNLAWKAVLIRQFWIGINSFF
ncbi:MAG: PorP/SprF family type IX secretion system membrane protein [Saprospiraceae bacterium]|nr:PorP/SprF family type IX secretion system membrane protein [Saprospiraceae bacterium]